MARTLSDTLIIAVIEAATRLTGARGHIAGSASAPQGGAAATPPAGEAGATGGTGATSTATAPTTSSSSGEGAPTGGGEHDSRSAEQIAADFRTIYTQIEELVKSSAEQETKAVGFGPVSR